MNGKTAIHRDRLTEEEAARYDHWLKNGFIRECGPEER